MRNEIPHISEQLSFTEAVELGIIDKTLGFVNPSEAFKKVNEQLIKLLKEGDLFWRKPWRDGYRIKGKTYGPQNYETQLPYRGFNAWMINFINISINENNTLFLTAKQIAKRGGKLKKTAVKYPVHAFIKGEKQVKRKDGKTVTEEYVGWVDYVVYPLSHTEGVKPIVRKTKSTTHEASEEIVIDAETLISGMPKRPPIKNGGNKAFYSPSGDYVQMPLKKAFKQQKSYYSVLFHELIHSTGHEKRVGRDFSGRKGDKKYAFEELIAELGASYLCAVCDIEYYTIKNSAAYLKSWGNVVMNELKTDKNFLFRAVYAASKAAKFIIGETLNKSGERKLPDVKNIGDVTTEQWDEFFRQNQKLLQKFAAKKSLDAREVSKIISYFGLSDKTPSTVTVFGAIRKYMDGGTDKKVIEVTPNKNIKASVQAAIEDLSKLPEYAKYGKMFLGMFYQTFKNGDSVDSIDGALKAKLFKKYDYDLFEAENTWDDVIEKAVLTDKGKELIKKIEGRVNTLKAKKQGTDLFPELAGVNDTGLNLIYKYTQLHNKTVSRKELLKLLFELQSSAIKGTVTSAHPYAGEITGIQNKLVKWCNKMKSNSSATVTITELPKFTEIIQKELSGLGFLPEVIAAAAGKTVEILAKTAIKKIPALNGVDTSKTAVKESKDDLSDFGFIRADKRDVVKSPDVFRLPGEIGKFVQDIQPYKYSIVLTGDPHAGKTEFATQLMDSFASAGKEVGAFFLEQGGLESKDTRAAVDRNISPENQKRVSITGEAPEGLKTLKKFAGKFDVVFVDSWQKLGVPPTQFDTLRHEHPKTMWVIIFQQNAEGGTRGGVYADYDSPVHFKVHKVDHTFKNNYVEAKKNRGNNLGYKYMIKDKKTKSLTEKQTNKNE